MNEEEKLRKRVEELEKYQRLYEDLLVEHEQFAYVASHDLQEPLRMISNYVSLLEEEYGESLDEEARTYIEFAVDGAKRMRKLIGGLLDLSRVGRSQEVRAVSSDEALDDALVSLEAVIAETGAHVSKGDLPRVYADPSMLAILFQNLIANSIKFRHEGTVPRIHVEAKKEGEAVVFAVQDNGVGFDSRYADRIFTVFQRLSTSTSGTGIGLSICKKIVERHGGRIWAESEPGMGATFYFTLRAEGAANGSAEGTSGGGQSGGRSARSQGAGSRREGGASDRVRWRRSASAASSDGGSGPGVARLELAQSKWVRGAIGGKGGS